MKQPSDILSIVEALKAAYPEALCSLDYRKDYELLFSTRLAAQCTDERVNMVTPTLFSRFPTLEALAEADVAEVEEIIHSTGFFRAKARDIVAASRMLLDVYGGKVPGTMEELLRLPGVGRKTANLVLGDIFHTPGAVVAEHSLYPHLGPAGSDGRHKRTAQGGSPAPRCPPARGVQRLLSPSGAPWPCSVHGPQAGLCRLYPAPLVRLLEQVRRVTRHTFDIR